MDEPPSSWRAKRRLIGALSSNQSGTNPRVSHDPLLSTSSQETQRLKGHVLAAGSVGACATRRRVARALPQRSLCPHLDHISERKRRRWEP